MMEQIQVHISNLPNNATYKDILDYLQVAGPIKRYCFNKDEQRLSVIVVYHDPQAPILAKKYLSQREFQGRDLKINYDMKKMENSTDLNDEDIISKDIRELNEADKKKLLGYLKILRDKEGKMFQSFISSMPKVIEGFKISNTSYR